jgi:Transposase DDE domain
MRSRKDCIVTAAEVHQCALRWLLDAKLLKDHGWLCSAAMVWNVVLRAAARMTSVFAACRDLAHAPTATAIFDALTDGLPRTLQVLEKRLNWALTPTWSRRLKRRAWQVAIDWHLNPYYGEPQRSRNELYPSKPRQGTSRFHAYATVCIIQYGQRYTLALTWVRRHESTVKVLQRLLDRCREMDVKIKRVLLDRAFFSHPVTQFLQGQGLPFLMPVMFRGRKPKKKRARTGLHALKSQKAGWYTHRLTKKGAPAVKVAICVAYRTFRHRKTGKRGQQKMHFAAWRIKGSPTEIRERYRKRFGIESSYRQARQARIYTCTRNPHLRLVFVAIAMMLRNLWVWLHANVLADGRGEDMTLRLERLRFKRLLDWIAQTVVALLHDGSIACVVLE